MLLTDRKFVPTVSLWYMSLYALSAKPARHFLLNFLLLLLGWMRRATLSLGQGWSISSIAWHPCTRLWRHEHALRAKHGRWPQIIEAHTVRLVDSECGQLLMKCSMSEVVERVRCAIESYECSLIPLTANSQIRAQANCTLALAFRHDMHLLSMRMVSKSFSHQNRRIFCADANCSLKCFSPCVCDKKVVLTGCICLGSKLSEGAVMAADASLSLERISQAMHAMFEMLSKPDVLPEFNALQVSSRLWPSLIAHLCIAEP